MDYRNASLIDDLKREFSSGSMINRLVIANLGVFLFIVITKIFFAGIFQQPGMFEEFISWLAVPYEFSSLLFKPWTILTYMFTHVGFLHILFNMLWLYWFGKIFIQFAGNRRVLPLYLMGGFVGAIFYVLLANLVPAFSGMSPNMIGASAGVTAIVVATAAMRPNYEMRLVFLGAVKIKWIALFMLLSDLVSISDLSNTGGHIAHLGGAAFGLLFGLQLLNGTDLGEGMNDFFDRLSGKQEAKKKSTPKPKIVYKRSTVIQPNQRPAKRPLVRKNDSVRQAKVDAILDKIKEVGGYDNLSAEEKEYLFRASKED